MPTDVDAIRAIYAALAEGDVGPLVERMATDIEWHEPDGAPAVSGIHVGRAAVLQEVLMRTAEVWAEFRIEPTEFIDGGDAIIVTGRLRVRAGGTGGRADVPFAHIWELDDGTIVRWRGFTDTARLHLARTSR